MSAKSEFHITIGAAFEDTGDVSDNVDHHLRLAKAALLYADKVTLCSPIALLLKSLSAVSGFTERQQIDLLEMVAPSITEDEQSKQSALDFCHLYRQAHSSTRPSLQELQLRTQFKNTLQPYGNELRKKAHEISQSYKLDQFTNLLNTKRFEIKPLGKHLNPIQRLASMIQKGAENESILRTGQFNAPLLPGNSPDDVNQMMDDYLKELERAIKNPSTYPLFDDFTGNLVRLGLKEGKIEISEMQTERAKPVGLAADLMERLPTFDTASVDEIIDIRKELNKPLVKFRMAMMKFSKDIKTAAWDEDFPLEAEEVFRAEIQPAIEEMEDSVKSNKFLYELAALVSDRPISLPTTTLLGAGLSTISQLPEVVSISLTVAGAGLLAWEAGKKWAEKQKTVENNQLFFYYKAGQMLENKRR